MENKINILESESFIIDKSTPLEFKTLCKGLGLDDEKYEAISFDSKNKIFSYSDSKVGGLRIWKELKNGTSAATN